MLSASDQFSQTLGEKLLQGWAMLDISCPKCPSIPLMRPRNTNNSFCVSCNSFIAQPAASHKTEDVNMDAISSPAPIVLSTSTASSLSFLEKALAQSLEKDALALGSSSADQKLLSLIERKLRAIQTISAIQAKQGSRSNI